MELCSMLYGSLDGRGVWGRMNRYLCMTESLRSLFTENCYDIVNWLCCQCCLVTKSSLTLCDPMDCMQLTHQVPLPMGFPMKLEWVAVFFSS